MPESAGYSSEDGIEQAEILELACILRALATISEQRQGLTAPYNCSMAGCGIIARNDSQDITHVLEPGSCNSPENSMYRFETILPDLEALNL